MTTEELRRTAWLTLASSPIVGTAGAVLIMYRPLPPDARAVLGALALVLGYCSLPLLLACLVLTLSPLRRRPPRLQLLGGLASLVGAIVGLQAVFSPVHPHGDAVTGSLFSLLALGLVAVSLVVVTLGRAIVGELRDLAR